MADKSCLLALRKLTGLVHLEVPAKTYHVGLGETDVLAGLSCLSQLTCLVLSGGGTESGMDLKSDSFKGLVKIKGLQVGGRGNHGTPPWLGLSACLVEVPLDQAAGECLHQAAGKMMIFGVAP